MRSNKCLLLASLRRNRKALTVRNPKSANFSNYHDILQFKNQVNSLRKNQRMVKYSEKMEKIFRVKKDLGYESKMIWDELAGLKYYPHQGSESGWEKLKSNISKINYLKFKMGVKKEGRRGLGRESQAVQG